MGHDPLHTPPDSPSAAQTPLEPPTRLSGPSSVPDGHLLRVDEGVAKTQGYAQSIPLAVRWTPKRIGRLKMEERALDLRSLGWDWEEIRSELKIPTIQQVVYLVQRAIKRRSTLPVEDLRMQEERKLDRVEKELMKAMLNDQAYPVVDPETGLPKLAEDGSTIPLTSGTGKIQFMVTPGLRLVAAEALIKLSDRRAKLRGLDAPNKVAHTDAQGNDLEVGALKHLDKGDVQRLAVGIVEQMKAKVEMDQRIEQMKARATLDTTKDDAIDITPEVEDE